MQQELNLNLEDFQETETGETETTDTVKNDSEDINLQDTEESNVQAETNKDKFIRMFRSIEHLSDKTKDSILEFLETTDFYTAPASARFHNNCPEGLVMHSINVAETLADLTVKNNLSWQHKDSPILIGLLHDICKVWTKKSYAKAYPLEKNQSGKVTKWGERICYQYDDKNPFLGIHGDRSVAMLLLLRRKISDFTMQELTCIRYHMGATMEGESQAFNNVIKSEPLAYWTHVADNIASMNEPVYSFE